MLISCYGASIRQRPAVLVIIEYEQSNSRREVAVLAFGIDRGDQISQRHLAARSYILQSSPERVLKADTRLVAPDHDGALNNR